MSLYRKFMEYLVPLTEEELQTQKEIQALMVAHRELCQEAALREKAEQDVILRKYEEEAAERKRVASREAEAEAQANKINVPKFFAKHRFSRGDENGFTLIVTCSESRNGRRRDISKWRCMDPKGHVAEVRPATEEFFRLQQIYTSVVLPWIHFELTTEEVRDAKFTANNSKGTLTSWIEFPLSKGVDQ